MKNTNESPVYGSFASVYDLFMDDVPYEEWCGYLTGLLEEYGISEGLVLDLGCGTGTLTQMLSDKGYDMIGIDNSSDMLEIAMEKKEESGQDILYLMQDMRELELYGTVRAVVSVCDSVNYILEEQELLKIFKLINNYLDPGGIFIFDLNTVYKYEILMGDKTIAENREEGSFIWENYYDPEENINEYDLTLFLSEENGLYHKYEETHLQRGYTLECIQALLDKAGLKFLCAYDAFTHDSPSPESERIYIIAMESGKRQI